MFGRKRIAALQAQLADLAARLPPRIEAIGAAAEGHTAWLHAIAQGLTDLGAAHGARLDGVAKSLDVMSQEVAALRQLIPALEAVDSKASEGLRSLSLAQDGHAAWLRALEQGLSDQRLAQDGHAAWLPALEQGLSELRAAHAAQLRDMGRWLASTTQAVSSLSSTPVISSPELQAMGPKVRWADERVSIARTLKIWSVMRWLAQAPIEATALISVIVPTRNRRAYLERAVASVLAQSYRHIDLVIVDDGSVDDTPQFLASVTDPRIRSFRATGLGASAARNLGLDNAIGEIITHLDDDNLMDPGWLHAVAWGFARWPDTKLLYGARIIEDGAARNGEPSGAMPVLEWQEFDRAQFEHNNYIDMNVIAHRAHLPEARFDAELRSSIEWDMLLKLTAKYTPLELPAIACLYSTYAPNRLTDRITYLQENQLVRARAHTSRALRVLSYNAMFPLLSETYIEEEMLALEGQGANIAFAAFQPSASPYPVRQPVYQGLDEAIAAHDPDVIMVYWASHALGELAHIERTGRPFALRVHSFDFDPDDIVRLQNHPSCLGVWAFPHHAAAIPGAHGLVPIFTTHGAMPPPAPARTTISSISAGLPKKDWPLLLGALAQLTDFDRQIVLARSNGFEDLPDEVIALANNSPHPPGVHVNLARHEVFGLLQKTAVLIYTVTPGVPLGMPMSVIEGLYAGACVITPESPEMKAMCKQGYRPYRDGADIVRHAREIMRGGALIEAERVGNHQAAAAAFCSSSLGRNFHEELSVALTSWRLARQRG